MSITSTLFKLARLSADLRAGSQAVKTGSARPILRRLTNKLIGRSIVSKLFWRK
jgi:hypothetical protein